MSSPRKIFISYAHEDEKHRAALEKHLSPLVREGLVEVWNDRKISASMEWKGQIHENLESADLILLLVSSSLLASDYVNDVEMKRGLERHKAGQAIVIPIIVRPCDWRSTSIGRLQALPTDGQPITGRKWKNQDEAWTDVIRGLRRLFQSQTGNAASPGQARGPGACAAPHRRPSPLPRGPRSGKLLRGAARHGRAGDRATRAAAGLHEVEGAGAAEGTEWRRLREKR
jgi:hypothetical protein